MTEQQIRAIIRDEIKRHINAIDITVTTSAFDDPEFRKLLAQSIQRVNSQHAKRLS